MATNADGDPRIDELIKAVEKLAKIVHSIAADGEISGSVLHRAQTDAQNIEYAMRNLRR